VVGETLGHYEIKEAIGAGGMGEVYRAHDTTLKRDVAIKVLPAAVTRDPDHLARLEREAQLLAALNHPNIATIHSFERADETRFLVLELVEGEALSEEIARGPMPLPRVLDVCGQIARALEAAHDAGIVHRDLKPANVIVATDGRAKVLDFGIAKSVAAASEGAETVAALTAAGTLLGTVPYMSPEQVRGQSIDGRTDVWAFGCLVFELLTGRQPFARATMADTLSATLEREPDWGLLPTNTPESVRSLLRRCLEKDLDRRLADIADAGAELGEAAASRPPRKATNHAARIAASIAVVFVVVTFFMVGGLGDQTPTGAAAPGAAGVRSIAVLPLQNLSGNPEDDAFADGMTEEITTQLAKLPGLRVIARSAALRFRQRPVDFAEVGATLGVDAVLDGSMRRSGGRVKVSAQLVEVAGSVNLWVDDFERQWTLDAVIGLQEEIALQIAAALDIQLTSEERQRLTKTTTANPEAYEFYLRSFSYLATGGRDDHMVGIDLLREAVAADPDFADAHAQLGIAYYLMVEWGYDVDPRWLELADAAARQALALNPDSSITFEALLVQSFRRGDPGEVRDLSKRLLAVDADSVTGNFILGYAYAAHGLLDAGQRFFEAALRVDPFFLPARLNLGTIDNGRGDLEAAERRMRELLGEYPEHPLLTSFLAYYLAKQGKIDEAIALAEPLRPIHPLSEIMLAIIHGLAGDFETARGMETTAMLEFVDTAPWPAYYLAEAYALQGRYEEVIAILDDQRRHGLAYRNLETSPIYAGARDQPEFQQLITRVKQDYCDFARDDENLVAAFARDCLP